MLLRSRVLLPLGLLVPCYGLIAQSIAWKVTDVTPPNNPVAITKVVMSTNAGGNNLNRLIKIDAPTAIFVTVTASPGSGLGGNWMQFAPVPANTDCSKTSTPYNSYPTTFSAPTPIYMCFSSGPKPPNGLPRGYYGAFITFTPGAGAALVLPVELDAFPSGPMQLSSKCQPVSKPTDLPCSNSILGDYNDHVFTYKVNGGVADSANSVYAQVVNADDPKADSNGEVAVPLNATKDDGFGNPVPWVTVSVLDPVKLTQQSAPTSPALFKIGVDPSQIPPGQTTVSGRVRIDSSTPQGESTIFVNVNISLPPPTLSLGVASLAFS